MLIAPGGARASANALHHTTFTVIGRGKVLSDSILWGLGDPV